jgi:hypothetical protein
MLAVEVGHVVVGLDLDRWPVCEHDPGSGWGEVDYQDVMACSDAACKWFGWIDPDRLGIFGGSYGGYMTSWTIGHTDRFRAACSERACNNLLTMEYTADIAGFLRSYVGANHLRSGMARSARLCDSAYTRAHK